MTSKKVIVAGFKDAGKTTFIIDLITWATKKKLSPAWSVFKPFDCGQILLNQKDLPSDGEIFAGLLPLDKAHSSIINPYMAYKKGPFEYVIDEDFNQPDFKKIEACLKKLLNPKKNVWIESPGSWYNPITSKVNFIDWAKKISSLALWVMSSDKKDFEANIAQIIIMKENFQNTGVVINNQNFLKDERWLNYCWQKIEFGLKIPVIGIYKNSHKKLNSNNIDIVKNGYQKFA